MRELLALIRDLSRRENRTILISSHQLYQIQQICDRVGLFVKGQLVACGTVEELAERSGGFHYEILCGIGMRVPRVYVKGGKIAGTKDYFGDEYFGFD